MSYDSQRRAGESAWYEAFGATLFVLGISGVSAVLVYMAMNAAFFGGHL